METCDENDNHCGCDQSGEIYMIWLNINIVLFLASDLLDHFLWILLNWLVGVVSGIDMMVVEFKQYAPGAQMRRLVLSKGKYEEHDDGMGRLYGGIRKIYSQHQIDTWKRLFPERHVSRLII